MMDVAVAVFIPWRVAPRWRVRGIPCADGHEATFAAGLVPLCADGARSVPFLFPEPDGTCLLVNFDLTDPRVYPLPG